MPVLTPNGPYRDRFDESKGYHKVLFKPSVPVQVGELNELQTILQNQIEKFGDNIFKKGTIIDGCNFVYHDTYPYVKISDVSETGSTVNPGQMVGLFAEDGNGVRAYIMDSSDGFENTDPDLKTLYIKYTNAGNTMGYESFTPGDTLTFQYGNNGLFGITVDARGSGFSNTDDVYFTSAIMVDVESGEFTNGEYITCPDTGSNLQITSISNTELDNLFVLTIKPRNTDLANASANSSKWTISTLDVIKNIGNTVIGTVVKEFGNGAVGSIQTDASGRITGTILRYSGSDYSILPTVSVRSANNTSGLASVQLTAKNYLTRVTIPVAATSVGNGYAFSIGEGIVYQKGYFLRVSPQTIVVSKYDQNPNNISVGFTTTESIINSNIDPDLLDNVIETDNRYAPGADRLRLTPTLYTVNTDIGQTNSEFFALVEWNSGNPYKVNQVTNYAKIGDEMAVRTKDASGNFVLDPFMVTTDCISNSSLESKKYTVVVDPGSAYVDGYRVKTLSNYRFDLDKGLSTKTSKNRKIGINYDKYIKINEAGGLFQFSTGDTVKLYNTAKGFLSNTSLINAGNTDPVGSLLGTARIRSMVLDEGTPGDSTAVYKLYLFDISTRPGKNFKNTKSIYYDGTAYKGIADVVLEQDATSGANVAILYGAQNDSLVFETRFESIKNSNNTTYTYRTIDQTTATSNGGLLVKSIAASPNEFYPYSDALVSSQLKELYVVPVSRDLVAYTSLTGTITCNTTSPNVVGSGTTFITDLRSGDYVTLANSTANTIKKVVSVVNNTLFVADSNSSVVDTGINCYRTFPKNVPVPLGTRSGLTANVDSNGNILTVNFGMTFAGTTSANTLLGVNIERTGVTSTAKTATRNRYVKLRLANSAASVDGPWSLGVPDAIRLRNVYVGTSTVNVNSTSVLSDFYIDNNQTVDYLGLSYLYQNPKSGLELTSSDYLLVEFDYMVRADDGYFDTVSYLGTSNAEQIAAVDALKIDELSSAACSWEVPEMYTKTGKYYDLLNCIDFRPAVANTVNPSTTVAGAPINPSATVSFGNTADPNNSKKFPVPGTLARMDIESYLGRVDTVIMGGDGNIDVLPGLYSENPAKRLEAEVPDDALKLQTIVVPPYPNITQNITTDVFNIIDKNMANELFLKERLESHKIVTVLNANNVALEQPKAYTMAEIAQLERRVKTLEYYTELSLLETSITNKVIPSSNDKSINRFKFGFFVDDFSSTLYSSTKDPQYAATLEPVNQVKDYNALMANSIAVKASNLIAPPKFIFGMKHNYYTGNTDTRSRTSTITIRANQATEAAETCNLSFIVASNSTAVSTNTYLYRQGSLQMHKTPYRRTTDNFVFTVSANVSGPAKLFWCATENSRPADPFFAIRQTTNSSITELSGSRIADTSTVSDNRIGNPVDTDTVIDLNDITPTVTSVNAIAITNSDFQFLSTSEYTTDFLSIASTIDANNAKTHLFNTIFNSRSRTNPFVYGTSNTSARTGNYMASSFISLGQGWVAGIGEINFTFDPSAGKTLIVTATTANDPYLNANKVGIANFCWLLVLPVSSGTGTGIVVDPCGAPVTTTYNGTMTIDQNQSISVLPELKQYDYVGVQCSGLKPSTKHYLFIDGINNSNVTSRQVRPLNGNFGDDLITGPDGKIAFEIYYPDSISVAGSTWSNTTVWRRTTGTPLVYNFTYTAKSYSEPPTVSLELKTVGSSCNSQSSLFFDNL